MVKFLGLHVSDKPDKKYYAEFLSDSGRKKRTYFGSAGMMDYTRYPADVREKHKKSYLARHKSSESWNDPTTAGSLSRWLLWETPSLTENLRRYKERFNF